MLLSLLVVSSVPSVLVQEKEKTNQVKVKILIKEPKELREKLNQTRKLEQGEQVRKQERDMLVALEKMLRSKDLQGRLEDL